MDNKKLVFKTRYSGETPVTFEKGNYLNNNNLYIGVIAWDEGYPEPWCDMTVNLQGKLPDNYAYVDTNNGGNELLEFIIENNLGTQVGVGASGFCVYPLVKFHEDFVNNIESVCS